MGTVVHLKKQINNSYYDLRNSVEGKLVLVEEKINSKLTSRVDLVHKMTEYDLKTGGKRLRALLTLESAKLCGYCASQTSHSETGSLSRDRHLSGCRLFETAQTNHECVENVLVS